MLLPLLLRLPPLLGSPRCPSLARLLSSPAFSPAWRERLQAWSTTLSAAEAGAPDALTDVGWAYHAGLVPSSEAEDATLPADPGKATEMFRQAADKGYAPASSLLADLHYYAATPAERERAKPHLERVLESTDEAAAGDAYVRVRALQKLGVLSHESGGATPQFEAALDLCERHGLTNYAFLLPHDPVNFFEELAAEEAALDDVPALARNLAPFESKHVPPAPLPALTALRAYTRALRAAEGGASPWLLSLSREALGRFGCGEAGAFGVTFLGSFMRVAGHPVAQGRFGEVLRGGGTPHVVSLGSALGNSVVWPAAAFGFTGKGYDVLESAVGKARELVAGLKGEGGRGVGARVSFEAGDVLEDEGAAKEIGRADLVWANDHSWGEEAQRRLEELCWERMQPGACLVLYRKPAGKHGWDLKSMGLLQVPTSWHPKATMVILKKP